MGEIYRCICIISQLPILNSQMLQPKAINKTYVNTV